MGSYKWVIGPLIGVRRITTSLITPLITTDEPASIPLKALPLESF